ncbi:TM0106 family RecB-like putative nuclease [Propionicicella superfundia]|uniref:TM0106 family RecB-like putative nuclease n=1 Tax=Propionicicella superfundia TaxID=348582 RepID=UPI0003FCE067|nr:TM0106 family RecB-like putative nuclease [Propionicicella superfundia]
MTWSLGVDATHTCPVKVRHAFTSGLATPPPRPLPSYAFSTRAAAARLLDEFVAAQEPASVADLRPLSHLPAAEREHACSRAMTDGARVIVGATLPSDPAGHRHGTADILVRGRAAATGRPGYRAVQVHGRRVLDARPQSALLTSTFAAPRPGTGHRLDGVDTRLSRVGDRLELAHLWHLLDAAGHASEGVRLGGLVGTDRQGVIAWMPLDEPCVPDSPRVSDGSEAVSVMVRYAEEFGFRLRTARAARVDAPGQIAPIRTIECDRCQWWPVCRRMLDGDDLSLRIAKWPLDVHEISALRSLGVTTVADLAAADLTTLLPRYQALVAHRAGVDERLGAAARRARMMVGGIELERTRPGPIPLPSAPVEIDLDIEASADSRVYLWGFLVHDRRTDSEPYYRSFARFADLTEETEGELALAALTWLRDLVLATDARVYHYSDYELVRLAAIAAATPRLAWAPAFAAERFVDLFASVREHFFGVHGLGLKNVAHSGPGFRWRDPEPGGLNSQSWFRAAVHGPATGREAARRRVLAYNEDDVRATWHLRRWLRDLS